MQNGDFSSDSAEKFRTLAQGMRQRGRPAPRLMRAPLSGPGRSAPTKHRHHRAGRTCCKLRQQTAEPVFGIIKQAIGFRRVMLRGLEKVSLEWILVTLSYHLRRLHTLGAVLKAVRSPLREQSRGRKPPPDQENGHLRSPPNKKPANHSVLPGPAKMAPAILFSRVEDEVRHTASGRTSTTVSAWPQPRGAPPDSRRQPAPTPGRRLCPRLQSRREPVFLGGEAGMASITPRVAALIGYVCCS